MRRLLFGLVAVAFILGGFTISSSVSAQNFNFKAVSENEPHTGMPSDQWAAMMKTFVNAKPIIGKPDVYMINATPYELTVICDKWTLVGEKPYISTNPRGLPAWTVTLVNAEGFDGYCKAGVVGQSSSELYQGTLNAADKSFTNSTFITFSASTKR